jgi:hypothetical protein
MECLFAISIFAALLFAARSVIVLMAPFFAMSVIAAAFPGVLRYDQIGDF